MLMLPFIFYRTREYHIHEFIICITRVVPPLGPIPFSPHHCRKGFISRVIQTSKLMRLNALAFCLNFMFDVSPTARPEYNFNGELYRHTAIVTMTYVLFHVYAHTHTARAFVKCYLNKPAFVGRCADPRTYYEIVINY